LKQSVKGVAVVSLLAACSVDTKNAVGQVEGPGQNTWECKDGHDNDGDGLLDCEDPDCGETEYCSQPTSPGLESGFDSYDTAVDHAALVVEIVPSNPTTEDDLECLIAEPLAGSGQVGAAYRFVWNQGGHQVSETNTVLSDHTAAGQGWTCEVTVTFPNNGREVTASAAVEVLSNGAPSAPRVLIQDMGGYLVCLITKASEDPDGDPVRYGYSWDRDNEATEFNSAVVSNEETSAGETWTCHVSSSDGHLEGATGSASIVLVD